MMIAITWITQKMKKFELERELEKFTEIAKKQKTIIENLKDERTKDAVEANAKLEDVNNRLSEKNKNDINSMKKQALIARKEHESTKHGLNNRLRKTLEKIEKNELAYEEVFSLLTQHEHGPNILKSYFAGQRQKRQSLKCCLGSTPRNHGNSFESFLNDLVKNLASKDEPKADINDLYAMEFVKPEDIGKNVNAKFAYMNGEGKIEEISFEDAKAKGLFKEIGMAMSAVNEAEESIQENVIFVTKNRYKIEPLSKRIMVPYGTKPSQVDKDIADLRFESPKARMYEMNFYSDLDEFKKDKWSCLTDEWTVEYFADDKK